MDDCASSIVFSLQAVARQAGYEIDGDDLCAALGLSWMVPAAPFEKNLGCWPMYARDAFLVEGARLFGMTVRGVHPPQAARGLERLPEFRQHFDASYRPLILNALENNQAVLAWRGWPGEHELCWGVIAGACDGGIGFEGMIRMWVNDPPYPSPLILESPPVQLYVIETVSPTQPQPGEVLNVALTHARCALNNGLEERFGVVTGPATYDAWIDRWREAAPAGRPPSHDLIRGHRRLAAATVSANSSAIRFLERHKPHAAAPVRAVIETLAGACHTIVSSLESCSGHDPAHGVAGGQCPPYAADRPTGANAAAITDAIARAREATKHMRDALQSM